MTQSLQLRVSFERAARLILASILSVALADGSAIAEQPRSLDKVTRELGRIEQNLKQLHETRRKREQIINSAEKKLRRLDQQLTTLSTELSQLGKSVSVSEKKRARLRSREKQLSQRLDAQRRLLAEHLRGLQRRGRQARAAALFSAASTGQYLRNQQYFSDYLRARQALVAKLGEESNELRRLRAELDRETERLAGLKQAVESKRQQLALSRQRQRRALAALTTQQTRDQEKVGELVRNRQALRKLMEQLRYQSEHSAVLKDTGFGRLKGKLGWPVQGKVRKSRLPGVTIETAANAPVRAVAGGRVVFADEMRGFGRLVIIDHGGGYMSLYGQNRRLAVKEGEEVVPGAVIATSGNASQTGVYFEIRHKAAPLDPRQWCKR